MLRTLFLWTAVVGHVALLACVAEDPSEPRPSHAVAEASGPSEETPSSSSDVPVEALGSLEKVYVPILGSSMQSLDDALEQKGYGNVKGSDFKPQFRHADTDFGPAVVAYSSSDWVDREHLFQPMSVTQWLEAALADDSARGVIINPGHPGQVLALTKQEAVDAIGWLPRQQPLAMEIYVAQ